MRHPAFTDQRTAHQNKTFIDELIDKRCVFIPEGLLPRVLRWIAVGTCGRDCDERIFHCRHSVDHSGLIPVGTPPGSRPGLISVAPQAPQAAIDIEAAPREKFGYLFFDYE